MSICRSVVSVLLQNQNLVVLIFTSRNLLQIDIIIKRSKRRDHPDTTTMMLRSFQRLSSSPRTLRTVFVPEVTRLAFSDRAKEKSTFFPDASVHVRGDLPYGSREYVLLPPHVTLEDLADEGSKHLKLASLQAHRNVIFGAALHYQQKDDDLVAKHTLTSTCLPLLDAAIVDASADGEQPQAVSTLHGLSAWVAACFQGQSQSKVLSKMQQDPEQAVSLAAAQSIATGIPRPGHSVVGQGTYRDGATAWEELAKEYVSLQRSEECQLYQARGAELVGIELLADTSPEYLRSAGGSMARLFFL